MVAKSRLCRNIFLSSSLPLQQGLHFHMSNAPFSSPAPSSLGHKRDHLVPSVVCFQQELLASIVGPFLLGFLEWEHWHALHILNSLAPILIHALHPFIQYHPIPCLTPFDCPLSLSHAFYPPSPPLQSLPSSLAPMSSLVPQSCFMQGW